MAVPCLEQNEDASRRHFPRQSYQRGLKQKKLSPWAADDEARPLLVEAQNDLGTQ